MSEATVRIDGDLVAKSIVGEKFASGYVTENSPNAGFTDALAEVPAGAAGVVTIDPEYSGTDTYTELQHIQNVPVRSIQYPSNLRAADRRGNEFHLAYNLPAELTAAYAFASRKDDGDANVSGGNTNVGLGMFTGGPSSYHADGHETTAKNLEMYSYFASKGIHQNINVNAFKYGCGDFGPFYQYTSSYGGVINGDDEGHTGFANLVTEGNIANLLIPVKQITSSYVGEHNIQMFNCTDGPNSSGNEVGAGRYAVRTADGAGNDTKIGVYTVTANNFDPLSGLYGTLTVQEDISPDLLCAAYGLSAPFAVPPNQDVAQEVQVTITLQGGVRNQFLPGIACMYGPYRNERVLITDVVSQSDSEATAGQPSVRTQVLTMLIRTDPGGVTDAKFPSVGAYFFQDQRITDDQPQTRGFSQTVLRFGAWDKRDGSFSQNIPLCAALDKNTLVYASNSVRGRMAIPGYEETIPQVYQTKVGRRGGYLYFSDEGVGRLVFNSPECVVSGCADDTLNGTGTPSLTPETDPGQYLIGYKNSGSDVQPLAATVTVGAGRNVIFVYQAAEVIRVTNPAAAQDQIGTCFGLESNDIPFQTGDIVQFPSHYSTVFKLANSVLSTKLPSTSGNSQGESILYGGPVAESAFYGLLLHNFTPENQYLLQGGFRRAPVAIQVMGPHQSLLQWNTVAPTARVLLLDTADPTNPYNSYSVFEAKVGNPTSASGTASLQVNPFLLQMSLGFANGPGLLWDLAAGTMTLSSAQLIVNNQVRKVANATDALDAVNLQQLQAAVSGLTQAVTVGSQTLHFSNGLLTSIS